MATNGIKEINVSNTNYLIEPTLYTTIKQTSAAATFTADLTNFELFTGVTVAVKFGVTNNGSATLNINGTGAKAIYYEGAAIAANKLKAKHTYVFTYNGTQWELVGDLDTDTNMYHKSGSWSGLTYTATAVNNADELKFTIPTGTSGTTVAVGNHNHDINNLTNASSYLKWQTTTAESTALYDFGVYVNMNHVNGSGMNGSNYFNILNIPYRKASGNTKADWGWQLGNVTGNDGRLWYRTAGDNVWGDWQTIAHATQSTSDTGSSSQPVYMTKTGVITPITAVGAAYGGTGKTTLNDSANVLINALTEGASPATANDYLIAQYAGGGTTTTTYHRRKVSNVVNATVVKAALGTDSSTTTQWLNKKGEWSTPTAAQVGAITKLSSSTDNAIVRFDGTAGQVQNSTVTIDDNGNMHFGNEDYIMFQIKRKKDDGGGWAYTPIAIKDNAEAIFANIGVYGTQNNLEWIYLGADTAYNSAKNLKILPSGRIRVLSLDFNGNENYGGDTQPIYWKDGAPKACTALGASAYHADSYFVKAITSTNNAIVRFDSTAGQIQNSGVIIDDNNIINGYKTLKYTSRIYPFVTSGERSAWYKITFPYATATTTSSAKWFMNSFDLHFGGGYNANPSGVAHVTFYWTRASNNGAWAVNQQAAFIEGTLANKIGLYYRIAEPGVLYVSNLTNVYNGIWIDNLYVDDTALSLDWSTTKIENVAAITNDTDPPLSAYTKLTTTYLYNDGGVLKTNANFEGQHIKGTWLYTSAATAKTSTAKLATIESDNFIYYITPANALKSAVGTTAIGGASTPIYWDGSAFTAGTALSDGAYKSILNNTSAGALGWNSAGNTNANNLRLINVNTLAYWNGAYSGTSSNLTYYKGGAFGTMAKETATDYAKLASPTFTGTPKSVTPSSSSDSKMIATKEYVDGIVAANDAMVYKGVKAGAATSSSNAYGALTPAANCGDTYKVSVAGFINGLRVEVGDMLICTTDNTAEATSSNYTTIRNNWNIIQTSEGSVSTSSTSSTDNAIARWDSTSGRIIQDSKITIDDNGNLLISHATSATMTADSTNPKITFAENGSQPVHLIYSDYYSYRSPAGLKIIGGTSATPAWLEVEGNVYAAAFKGNADTATTATNLAAKPSLATSSNNITVTAGGKTSDAFTVPYATKTSSANLTTTANTFAIFNNTTGAFAATDFQYWQGVAGAGKSYIGWVKFASMALNTSNQWGNKIYDIFLNRTYNSPSSEVYNIRVSVGWNNSNIIQLSGHAGTQIMTKFRIARNHTTNTAYFEYYVDPSYSTYQNAVYIKILGYHGAAVTLINEVQTEEDSAFAYKEEIDLANGMVSNGNFSGIFNGNATGISATGGSTAKFWRGDNTWSDTINGGTLKITNQSNTVTIGSQNTSFTHIYNSATIPFIFNNTVLTTSGNLGNTTYPFNNLYIGAKGSKGIYYVGTNSTNQMITFVDNTSDGNGNGIKIGGGGVVVIGSGESSALNVTGGDENLYLISDSSAYLEANAQTLANRIGIGITTNGHIIPVKAEAANNNAQNLGSSSAKWANVYATTFTGDLTGNAATASQLKTNSGNTPHDYCLQYYSGQPTVGTADGNAYTGSSNNYKLWSYPDGATSASGGIANVQVLRFWWSTNYLHDIFVSPNYEEIYYRSIIGGTAKDWRKLLDSGNTAAGTDNNATLAWNTTYTIAKINGTDIKFKTMAKPTYTYSDVGAAAASHDHNRLNGLGRLSASADAIAFNTTTSVGNRMSWCIYDSASRTKDATNSPSFDASTINMPWDWGAYMTQLALQNAGTRLQIRGANHVDNGEGANPRYTPAYTAWREIVTADKATQMGSATQPVYINSTGQVVACTAYSSASVNYATSAGSATTASKLTAITTTDAASSTATWRRLWISYSNNTEGRPAYTDSLVYQTSTNTLKTPHLLIEHTSGGQAEMHITYSDTIDYWWGVGTANENHGLYDIKANKWILSAGAANTWTFVGNVTGNVSGSSGSCTGNAATATKTGVAAIWLYPEGGNEINFGGTQTGTTIYFGYRAKDSRAIPTKFVFGSSTGTADLQAKTVYLGSGTTSYVSSTQYTGNAATASKISAKLAATTKTYLLGTATAITTTAANVDITGDTGVYLTTTAGELSAVRHSWNANGTEKAYTIYNTTDDSIDFVFI